jgi:hypothetical protein
VEQHPIQVTVSDDLRRNRLTVAFRLILAIPHIVWLALWGIAASLAVIVSWFATLITGRTPDALHEFLAQYLRYSVHVSGYLTFLGDAYPGFVGDRPYAADLSVAPPQPQDRWKTAFRIILAIPVLIVAQVLSYLQQLVALISWFACLFTGAMPLGLRNLAGWIVRFNAQAYGYVMLLTERYPSFSPEPPPAPR